MRDKMVHTCVANLCTVQPEGLKTAKLCNVDQGAVMYIRVIQPQPLQILQSLQVRKALATDWLAVEIQYREIIRSRSESWANPWRFKYLSCTSGATSSVVRFSIFGSVCDLRRASQIPDSASIAESVSSVCRL